MLLVLVGRTSGRTCAARVPDVRNQRVVLRFDGFCPCAGGERGRPKTATHHLHVSILGTVQEAGG